MLVVLAILAVGLFVLAKASTLTIKNAVRFSKLTGMNEMTVGFVIIAVSTSIPEFVIGVMSSASGNGMLSFGNVIGANVSNMALIFGVLAFYGFTLSRKDVNSILNTILLAIMLVIIIVILGGTSLTLGVFLLAIFFIFSRAVFSKGVKVKQSNSLKKIKTLEAVKYLIYLLLSIAAVVVSASFVVNSAVAISESLGLASAALGATVIAIGTTLPEMSVNIAALRRKNIELAVGDSMGSIVANLGLVAGTASLISPISLNSAAYMAIGFMILAGIIFMLMSTRRKFGVAQSLILLSIYSIYLIAMLLVVGT